MEIRRKQTHRKKGFTLLELVISIGLLSIIIVIGVDILSSILRVNRRVTIFNTIENAGNSTINNLKENIRRSVSVEILDSSDNPVPDNPSGIISGDSIKLSVVDLDGSNTDYVYRFKECVDENDRGSIDIAVDSGTSKSLVNLETFGADPESYLYSEISVKRFKTSSGDATGKPEFFTRVRNSDYLSSNSDFDILYISFSIGETCDYQFNAQQNFSSESYFQTAVNLWSDSNK